jgi:thioredoxin 1
MAVVTDRDFSKQVLADPGVVLVDFWAPWCGPCRMLGPIVEQLAAEYGGRAKVLKLNVDENPFTPRKYGIMGIPTILIFKGGQVVEEIVGVRPKAYLAGALEKWLQAA